MPTIAIVSGVRLVLYLNDHLPPHIHALFGDYSAMLSIATGDVLQGKLPKAKLKAVQAFLDRRREQVAYYWEELREGRSPGGMIE